MQKKLAFLKKHLILLAIICLGTFLRIFQLDRYAILPPEIAHELVFGSSIETAIISVFGTSTYTLSLIFALFGVAALITLYELTVIYVDKKTAYFSVALLAVFPLAIAHSRMPFHTAVIPFAVALFLFSLMMLWEKNTRQEIIVTSLATLFLISVNFSLAPLAVLIPYSIWRKKYTLTSRMFFLGLVAVLLVILPFLFKTVFSTFWYYTGRILSVDQPVLKIIGFLGLAASAFQATVLHTRKKLPPLIEVTLLAMGLLLIQYLWMAWGSASISEFFFAPFFICFAIVLGFGLSQLPKKFLTAGVATVLVYMLINTLSSIKNNYFVENTSAFTYESYHEQRMIAHFITYNSQGKPYRVTRFQDILHWIALEDSLVLPGTIGSIYLIEEVTTSPPNMSLKLHTFTTKVVYKVPNVY